ncbi:MAG: isochorismatase family protein, partial [Anaerolineae bacterium]|nr:isochorismatase family protein [Anaerolineae bacterium]
MTGDTALLVIDVQQGLIDEGAYQADVLLKHVGSLTAKARGANVPVIYIQHDADDPRDSLYPSSPGNAIVAAIAPHPGEMVVHKTTASVFDSTQLQKELEAMGIHRLVITGMQTDYCVNASSRGALKLGYDVTLVSDAHTTGDSPT